MIAADPFQGRPEGLQRGRGGFLRSANDVPYVSDPSGAVVKSGARKGEVKRLAYGSPSNRGKEIENSTNLVKWGERRVVLGIGTDRALVDDCSRLAQLEVDSDEYKVLADGIILRAKDAAKAMLAADRGTHAHALTEDHDTDRDIVARAEHGELLGIGADVQRQLVDAWRAMLDANGLEVLAVEESCVDDRWRLAGTLDRIMRTSRPLSFRRNTGEVVTVPAGLVVVVDVKTSNKRADRDGSPRYWNAYSIQVASYAQSVPYDTEAETRGQWPWSIDQTHALIARPNLVEVLAGDAEAIEWELIHVDLVAGREHGGECVVVAKDWERRTDVFSVAQIADEHADPADEHAVPDEPPLDPEGDPADERAVLALQVRYRALSTMDQAWIKGLAGQAADPAVGVPFDLKSGRTVRRFEIMRGLVIAAERREGDQHLRELLSVVVPDAPTTTPLGAVLGSLSAQQAATFARLVDGSLVPSWDDTGRLQLIAA